MPDARKTSGSSKDRRGDPSRRTRVYFWIAIGVACVAAYAAGTALSSSHKATHAATQAAQAQREVTTLVARVAADEKATCKIQQRGLPASHELAASMADIHTLLTLQPTTAAQKAQAAQTPPFVADRLKDLNKHLAKYQKLEAKQPRTRSCPT